jgi:dihydropyrimidinase
MHYDLVIQGGRIASSQGTLRADVGITGEKIAAVGLDLAGAQTIDASGKLVLPGAIDVHTHFQLPVGGRVSADDFATGSQAAALGGVTTFIDFAIPEKGEPMVAAVEARRAQADPKVCVDYGLHPGIVEWNPAQPAEIAELVRDGMPTFKMFMAYRARGVQASDADLYAALREAGRQGAMIGVHAENEDLIAFFQREAEGRSYPGCYAHAVTRPAVTETEAIARAIHLAETAGGRLYIFHLSTGGGADIVEDAILRGADVHAETCPHYLLLDDERFKRPDGHLFATCPPIRKPGDQERLWEGLARASIEVLATDSCTFTAEQKAAWAGDYRRIPFGLPGIETLLPLAHTFGVRDGRFGLERMVDLLCETPARLFGLWPRKGTLSAGSDADLVVFDPSLEMTISTRNLATNCDYSPYEGTRAIGWPITTLVRGQVIVRDRAFVGRPGQGRFVRREPPARGVDG